MPEANERLSKLGEARRTIEETLVVMVQIEKRQSEMVKIQAESAERHEAWLTKHETSMQEFDAKPNALIDIVSRQQGGMESRP
jgi:hypothetical protein